MEELFLNVMIPDYALSFTASSFGVYAFSCVWILFAIVTMFGSDKGESINEPYYRGSSTAGPWRFTIALSYVMMLVITNVLGDEYDLWVYWLVPGVFLWSKFYPYIGRLHK